MSPEPQFAMHIARGMPIEPVPAQMAMRPLPMPAHEDPVTEFLYRTLHLPVAAHPGAEVAPRGIEAGLQHIWEADYSTGLFMPQHEARLRALESTTLT